jgi:SnoaL-like protein
MSDVTTTVDTYLAMWNEQDASRRGELIEQAWTKDGAYLDPALEATGHAALSEMVAQVHERFPGYSFTRTSGIDEHHGLVRFAWQLGDGNGTVAVAGLDVGELADDGKLRRITGFFGELPAD